MAARAEVAPVATPVAGRATAGDLARAPFGRQLWALLRKDLVLEWRSREVLAPTLVFALLTLVIFTFALDLRTENVGEVAPGALWVAFVFAGMLALGRGFAAERDHGTLDGLLLAPVDRAALFAAKAAGTAVFMLAAEVVVLPVFVAFFNLPVLRPALVPVLLLGTLGFAGVGTLFAAIAANTRAREVMLPVLLFPMAVPVVIGSVKATAAVIDGGDWGPWLSLLVVFDAVFGVLALWLFPAVIED